MVGIKEQAFGMELEFNGITRKRAAEVIGMVINGRPDYTYCGGVYHTCKVRDSEGRDWSIVRDGSVNDTIGEACEFVTPKCRYEDIPKVQECIRALRKAGARVDKSCGLHIHVDAANHTAKSLKNLVFTMKAKQDLIFRAVKTQPSRLRKWCRPIDQDLVDNIKQIKKLETDSVKYAWYGTYEDWHDETDHYHDSRYHALNLHSVWYRGTVEFRLFEATLHAGEVRAYINLCLAMSAQAINAKRASAEVLDNGNDKYSMRCWLLRLGFIGDEWKTVRQHLLKNLDGNAAWRNEPTSYESYNNRTSA